MEEEVWLVPLLTCHCGPSRPILVLINEAVGSDSLGKSRAVFPFTEAAHVYLPTTDGPPGAPRGPQGSFALGILRLNQRTGSRAPSPDLQVTLAFYHLPKAVTMCWLLAFCRVLGRFCSQQDDGFVERRAEGGKKVWHLAFSRLQCLPVIFFFFIIVLSGK